MKSLTPHTGSGPWLVGSDARGLGTTRSRCRGGRRLTAENIPTPRHDNIACPCSVSVSHLYYQHRPIYNYNQRCHCGKAAQVHCNRAHVHAQVTARRLNQIHRSNIYPLSANLKKNTIAGQCYWSGDAIGGKQEGGSCLRTSRLQA